MHTHFQYRCIWPQHCWAMQKKTERRERQLYNITNAITLVCQCILVRIFSTNTLIWRVRVYSTKMRLTLNSPCHKYGRIFLKIFSVSYVSLSRLHLILVQFECKWCERRRFCKRERRIKSNRKKHCPYLILLCVFDNFDYAVPFRTPNEHFWYKSFKFTSLFVSLNQTSCCDWNEWFPIRICEIFSNKSNEILLEIRSKRAPIFTRKLFLNCFDL